MDGPTGTRHPELGAEIAAGLFGKTHGDLVLLHSRRYAKDRGLQPSKLCWADKLSILFEPEWLYLLRARASGELAEYRKQATAYVPIESSDRAWLRWIKRRFARSVLAKARTRSSTPRRRSGANAAEAPVTLARFS